MSDWLVDFEDWVRDVPTLPIFKRWAGVMALSSTIQRRRWVTLRRNRLYPTLYCILVSRPNSGKTQAINQTTMVLNQLPAGLAGLLPKSVTRASMLDALAENLHVEHSQTWVGASLYIDELSIILHEYDKDIISHWSELWDAKEEVFIERRRHAAKELRLERPFLSMFAGIQPSVLGSILPEHAWAQGFCSRTLFVFSDEVTPFDVSVFDAGDMHPMVLEGARALAKRLEDMTRTHQQVGISAAGNAWLKEWCAAGCPPYPSHEKLADYNGRRWLQALKVAMLRATGALRATISVEDLEWAKALLEETESGYRTMFMELRRQGDAEVYEDLRMFIVEEHIRQRNAGAPGVPRSVLWQFLIPRAASHRIESFINGMLLGAWMELAGPHESDDPWYRPTGKLGRTP